MSVKITGLDKMQKQLKEVERATEAFSLHPSSFQAGKKFLSKNNEKPSISRPVRASQRGAVLSVCQSQLCGDNAATGFW
ncbi:hypothetical protein F3J31_13700 [Enterobacter sp. Acro-832]|nr:hypothetical protein [Enterobacter sp. Acro-832]